MKAKDECLRLPDQALTQTERVLKWLVNNNDGLTPLDAWRELGCYRLSDVIFKLKAAGYAIENTKATVQNRFHEECHVACYVLHDGDA